MPKLIKGQDLNSDQRRQVLAAYVHRWTFENAKQTYSGQCPGCVQRSGPNDEESIKDWHAYHKPLETDDVWLKDHAFYFVSDGSRLDYKHDHCEPSYMAD